MGKAPHPLDRWRAANAAEADAVRAAAEQTEGPETSQESPLTEDDELLLVEAAREDAPAVIEPSSSMPPRRAGDIAIGALFGILAAGWIGLWIGGVAPTRIDLAAIGNSIALASGPLALLGIIYMLIQRSTRGEVRRFGDTALSMRIESRRLEEAVARITAVLDNRRADLAAHAGALLDEGNRAAEKLQQISMDMRDETDLLARQTDLLHNAAGVARSDMSGLMEDLPASLSMVGEVNGLIKSIGGTAKQHADGLSETLSTIIARSHEADELIGAASGRLATQIGRIETRTERTARTIEEAAQGLDTAIDATLDRASAAIEHSRSSLDLQREAMAAMIDHGRAALEEAGTVAAVSLAERLSEMSALADTLSGQLVRQDEDARRLVANLEDALGAIESRFEALGATGTEQTADLAELVVSLSEHVDSLGQAVTNSLAGARTLTDRANGLRIAFDAIVGNVERDLPQTMQRVEGEAARGEAAMRTITTQAEQLAQAVQSATDRLGSVDQVIDRQRDAISGLGDQVAQRMAGVAAEGDAMLERQREQSDAFTAEINARLEALRAHSNDFARLVVDLDQALGTIEGRFETLGASGAEHAHGLAGLVGTLSSHVDNLGQALSNSMAGARALTDRAQGLRMAFDAIAANIERDLPQTMHRVEGEAARGDAAMRAVTAQAEQLASTVERATDRLASADTMIDRQREAIAGLGVEAARRMAGVAADGDAMLESQRALSDAFAEEANARLEALRDHSNELGRLIAQSEANMRSLSELSGGHLVEAILKVRETAGDAARGARAALESIIPASSEKLAKAGAEAIERAFGDQITQRIHLISDTAEAAVAAANQASEKLLKQLLSIAEASSSMEQRIAEVQAKHEDLEEQVEQDAFSREVAILIEHLNGAAIDVTKLMSHDVPDGAWKAYLHGDHGAFTRTAVRLLRAEEASRVQRLCENNLAFRQHVDRYIRDFEALLRRVLASRDGGALAVTILSSDMGKLYVALAQATERLPG